MTTDEPFQHSSSNKDALYCMLNPNNITLNKNLNGVECRGGWGRYTGEDVDKNNVYNTNISSTKGLTGKEPIMPATHIGDIYNEENVRYYTSVPVSNENAQMRTNTERINRNVLNKKTMKNVEKPTFKTVSVDKARTYNPATQNVQIPFNENGASFKKVKHDPVNNVRDNKGKGITENGVRSNTSKSTNSKNVITVNCANTSSTITNSTSANTSSRGSNKKAVDATSRIVVPTSEINSRNLIYSYIVPESAHTGNPAIVSDVPPNRKYVLSSKCESTGVSAEAGSKINSQYRKGGQGTCVNAQGKLLSAKTIMEQNTYNTLQNASTGLNGDKREGPGTNYRVIDKASNVLYNTDAMKLDIPYISAIPNIKNSDHNMINRLQRTGNIVCFPQAAFLRNANNGNRENSTANMKKKIITALQTSNDIEMNRSAFIPPHSNTAKMETKNIEENKQWNDILVPKYNHVVAAKERMAIAQGDDSLKQKYREGNSCNIDFNNYMIETKLGELRMMKSKTDDISYLQRYKEGKLNRGLGPAGYVHNSIGNKSVSVNINKYSVLGTEVKSGTGVVPVELNTKEKAYTQTATEQQKYSSYVNVDMTLEEDHDLLYSCRNRNRTNKCANSGNSNYLKNEKTVKPTNSVMNHVCVEKKGKNENEQGCDYKVVPVGYPIQNRGQFATERVNVFNLNSCAKNANTEPIQGQNLLRPLEEKEKIKDKGKEQGLLMNKNVTNECKKIIILNKEEFARILEEGNLNPQSQNTQELMKNGIHSASAANPSGSMHFSRNAKDMINNRDVTNVKTEREPSTKENELLRTNIFQPNAQKDSPHMIFARSMKTYDQHTRGAGLNQNGITHLGEKGDKTNNMIQGLYIKGAAECQGKVVRPQQTMNISFFSNAKGKVSATLNDQNGTNEGNTTLQNRLVSKKMSLTTCTEGKGTVNSTDKELLKYAKEEKNQHISDAFSAGNNGMHYMAKECGGRSMSQNVGTYTERTIRHLPKIENNVHNGYWTYRPEEKKGAVSMGNNYIRNGLEGTKHVGGMCSSGMKASATSPNGTTCRNINEVNGTGSFVNPTGTKGLGAEKKETNHIFNKTLSIKNACARTNEEIGITRCKTMTRAVYNDMHQMVQKETTIGFHSPTILKPSHFNSPSHRIMTNHHMGSIDEKSAHIWDNMVLDAPTKTTEETAVVKKAVVIGCNYFRDKDQRLYGSANDAYVFSRTLVKYFDFSPENIILITDCFPAEAYVNAEFDIRKEEREEKEAKEEKKKKEKEKLLQQKARKGAIKRAKDKKNIFSLFNKNGSKADEKNEIKEPNSVKVISCESKDVDLLTHSPHVSLWPTRTNILKAVNWLVRDSVANGTYVFYFAGKSIQVDNMSGWEGEGYDEAFLCSDPFIDNSEQNIITAVQLKDLLLSINSKANMTIVLDCSGCQTILDPAGTENSWSYIKGCKQKGIWPITNPTNKVHKAVYDTSILNNESMKKHFCKSRFANLIEVDSTSAMIDPLLQSISSPTIPPKACCLCAATWEQVSIEGFFPVFRFARVSQIKRMKIPDFPKKKKKKKKKTKEMKYGKCGKSGKTGKNGKQQLSDKTTKQKKKNIYGKRFDISVDLVKTFFTGSQNGKGDAHKKKNCKSKKKGVDEKKEENGAEDEECDNEDEEEEEEVETEDEEEEDCNEEEFDDENWEEDGEEDDEEEEEEESEIIVSHGVFTYCLIESIIEFKEQELKNNILESSNSLFLPMTLKNLINVVQEKIQNVKNKKLKKLNQKPEFTLHPGSNVNINNYFVHYSKNIHFQNSTSHSNSNYLGYNMTPYLNVLKAWEQINKSTLRQQKSLTLTTSLNKVARTMSMSASNNVPVTGAPNQISRS